MKLGQITQSFVYSLLSVSETDHAPEQGCPGIGQNWKEIWGEILMDTAAVPTVSSLMSRLISLTLNQKQPTAYTSIPGKTLLLRIYARLKTDTGGC